MHAFAPIWFFSIIFFFAQVTSHAERWRGKIYVIAYIFSCCCFPVLYEPRSGMKELHYPGITTCTMDYVQTWDSSQLLLTVQDCDNFVRPLAFAFYSVPHKKRHYGHEGYGVGRCRRLLFIGSMYESYRFVHGHCLYLILMIRFGLLRKICVTVLHRKK